MTSGSASRPSRRSATVTSRPDDTLSNVDRHDRELRGDRADRARHRHLLRPVLDDGGPRAVQQGRDHRRPRRAAHADVPHGQRALDRDRRGHVRVYISRDELLSTGERVRRIHDLALRRNTSPLFFAVVDRLPPDRRGESALRKDGGPAPGRRHQHHHHVQRHRRTPRRHRSHPLLVQLRATSSSIEGSSM